MVFTKTKEQSNCAWIRIRSHRRVLPEHSKRVSENSTSPLLQLLFSRLHQKYPDARCSESTKLETLRRNNSKTPNRLVTQALQRFRLPATAVLFQLVPVTSVKVCQRLAYSKLPCSQTSSNFCKLQHRKAFPDLFLKFYNHWIAF